EFGRWMNVSHDGDRFVRAGGHMGNMGHMGSIESTPGVPAFAQIAGHYGCSIPEIDAMVDVALSVEGVFGAQISGAGLGGCIMVLAREEACGALSQALAERYYGPAGLPADVMVCTPV